MMPIAEIVRAIAELRTPVTLDALGALCHAAQRRGHLVVLRDPYLSKVLSGEKTLEARLSQRGAPPFRCVAAGDVLFIKKSAGRLLAVTVARDAEFHGPRDETAIRELLVARRDALCLEEAFLETAGSARYATFISIDDVTAIKPRRVAKSDLRGWVVLPESGTRRAVSPQRYLPFMTQAGVASMQCDSPVDQRNERCKTAERKERGVP